MGEGETAVLPADWRGATGVWHGQEADHNGR